MSDPESYTVGWICAITTEHVGARAFLDEVHDGPEYVSEHDNNSYTLGKVGKHNVVIAVLPDGEYGTASAASVASDMLHSFPNVRIGLMVGIGGGVPSRDHDIRLGDLVVSSPRDGHCGVFQYDFGKTIQDRAFRHTRYLNQPPPVLRAAVSGLKAQYKESGHRIEESINSTLEKKPRLRQEYRRPDPSSDRLYRAGFSHRLNNETSCAAVCGDDPSNLMRRPERTEMEDNPAIHYGLIASGNQLMKDALVRDTLAEEKDVLCFEMEAAGLMNHFPCLVIRGICDYSDSHKNKEWQGYAAMTAAAYAKDLLCQIPPNRVEAERKIGDILSSIGNNINQMHGDIQDTKNAVKDLGFTQRCEKIAGWLSPPDPSTNYDKALQQRQDGTGLWFLQINAFAKWKKKENSFLWLYGIPGCGKTILSSTIIEHLKTTTPRKSLLYFYFDFKDASKQTLESMVRSLINQLYCEDKDTWKQLDLLFSSCKNGHERPACGLLCNVLLQMIEQVGEVWIILDALDECSSRKGGPTEGLLSWIENLLNSEQRNVHLLVTSRPEHDIKSRVSEFAYKDDMIPIQSDLITDDIRAYIHTRVRQDQGLKRWQSQPVVQDEIETRLMEKANGMFRWAACQLDDLKDCLDYRSLRKALASLPTTLDETYKRILKGIPDKQKLHATRLLQFLTYSERPLKIKEAIDAIAVDTEEDPYFDPKYRMPDPREIACYCSSLVVVVPIKGYSYEGDDSGDFYKSYGEQVELQLAHFSVKEYLMSDRLDGEVARDFHEVAAKASIATVCLAYLLQLNRLIRMEEIREMYPLAEYSATYWMDHAAIAEGKNGKLRQFITELFCRREYSYLHCYKLCQPDRLRAKIPVKIQEKPAPALYYASFGGLVNVVQHILSQGADVNAEGGYYGNALQAASFGGHKKIVELLLKKGADINARGGDYGNALQAASFGGHEKIVELLLKKGADVNAQGGYYDNALQAASFEGHEKIVELLLKEGADVNAQGGYYGNALYVASSEGHEKIVELLFKEGASVNAEGGYYGNALQAASSEGHEKIVKLLLKKAADVNAQGGYYGNALQAASSRGYEKVVELLLKEGADVNAQGGYYGNTLYAASSEGHEKIVELLLKEGADVNAQGGYYGNALQEASFEGHEKIAELLLKEGANANVQGGYYGNALQAASFEGHEKIAELLLKEGANANTQGGYYGNALQAASFGGHEKIVELLLSQAANVNAQGGYYGNALQAASLGGHEKIAELLLTKGADANAQSGEYSNALQIASLRGDEKMVELLLKKGADVNTRGGWYGNALQAASFQGHESIVELLLKEGADLNAEGGRYGNALQAASFRGYKKIVALLRKEGAVS